MIKKVLKKILNKKSYNFLKSGKKIIIRATKAIYFPFKLLLYNIYYPMHYKTISNKLKHKDEINVAFFVSFASIWKYDSIYRMMVNNPLYNPAIFICPYTKYGQEGMLEEMDKAYKYFYSRDYNVVRVFNKDINEWYNIKKDFSPDIIFYTYPYKKFTTKEYFIDHYRNSIHFYVPYTFTIVNVVSEKDHFQNKLTNIFYMTEYHKTYSQSKLYNRGKNLLVTGYPGLDIFSDKSYIPNNEWKNKNKSLKKIIWAPHHTIVMNNETHRINFSNFLEIADEMLALAEKYNNKIQIAVKMHPLLPIKLAREDVWGVDKTNKYLEKWNRLPNAQVYNELYYDLFLTSDAMILDSASFIIEYLSLNKPSMFIQKDPRSANILNDLGKEALKKLYNGKNIEDIENFIIDTVLFGNDPMEKERKLFIRKYIVPPNGNTASENIMNYINSEVLS